VERLACPDPGHPPLADPVPGIFSTHTHPLLGCPTALRKIVDVINARTVREVMIKVPRVTTPPTSA